MFIDVASTECQHGYQLIGKSCVQIRSVISVSTLAFGAPLLFAAGRDSWTPPPSSNSPKAYLLPNRIVNFWQAKCRQTLCVHNRFYIRQQPKAKRTEANTNRSRIGWSHWKPSVFVSGLETIRSHTYNSVGIICMCDEHSRSLPPDVAMTAKFRKSNKTYRIWFMRKRRRAIGRRRESRGLESCQR